MAKSNGKESRISYFNLLGFSILIVCYLGALWNVFQVKKDEVIHNKKVIRFCHWQLEMGVRQALDRMIELYEKKHPDVKIVQIPIPERTYPQWVTTQLIGRTALDMIEIGKFPREYLGRYFIPITEKLREINPYNSSDSELKNKAWIDTFTDGLQNSYIPELLDYYSVGFSQFTVRIFYNKTLFKQLLGTDKFPENLEELFSYCQQIKEFVDNRNKVINNYNRKHTDNPKDNLILDPIASSRYQVNIFKGRYLCVLTADTYLALDINCDGTLSNEEQLTAFLDGRLKLENKKHEVAYELVKRLANYFPTGFMSVDRMDAGFSFVQSRSAMITSGSWDASSFLKQIGDQPFGDVILKVNGEAVSSVAGIRGTLLKLAESKEKVTLQIDREGARRTIKIKPVKGESLWECYGFNIALHKKSGRELPTITEVDSASPASDCGLSQRKRFEVGIFDFPMPTRNDPLYGKYFVGRVAETSDTGFNFGITKFSKHKDIAIDFLRFCTNAKNNQTLNEIAQWIPAVKGAGTTPFLKAFKPNFQGYWGSITFSVGERSKMKEAQVFWPYISNEMDYTQYVNKLQEGLPQAAAVDFERMKRNPIEQMPDKQIRRSIYLAEYLFAETSAKEEEAKRKLPACWDIVTTYKLKSAELKAMVDPQLKEDDDAETQNLFKNDFVDTYNKLKSQED